MITLYSGIPGSGKTYKMVAELDRCKSRYYVVHNIEGLKPEYLGDQGISFIKYCSDNNLPVEQFFSKEYQIEFCEAVFKKYQKPVLCIIDEAHEWFAKTQQTLKMWLSYHRHLNQDIWLVAHRAANIPMVYRSFIEIEYRAKSGAFLGVPMYFIYNRILGGQPAGYTKERKRQAIFDIYQSQTIQAKKHTKIPKVLPLIIAVVVILLSLFFYMPTRMLKSEKSVDSVAGVPDADLFRSMETAISKIDSLKIEFEKKFAFVGIFGDRVLLEVRATGEQLPLQRIAENPVFIENDRNDSVTLFVKTLNQIVIVYNSERYYDPKADERGTNEEAFGLNPTFPSLSPTL